MVRIDFKQLDYYHRTLIEILLWLEKETGVEFTTTSQWREDDDGVHGTIPLRGTDLRIRNTELGKCLEGIINAEWLYDPDRPSKMCARAHGEGANYHLHIQVHPNTRRM